MGFLNGPRVSIGIASLFIHEHKGSERRALDLLGDSHRLGDEIHFQLPA